MFVLSRNVSASYKVIATLVAAALIMWALGLHSFAQAANVTNLSDTLSDTTPGIGSDHTISFKAPSGIAAGEDITITFPAGFDLSSIDEDDIDLEVNGVDELTDEEADGATWGVDIDDVNRVVTLESDTDTIADTATITIKIGTNATGSGTGANQIINPNPADGNQSYEIAISAGTDTGYTRVVILNTVLVTAAVETTFEFTVAGVANDELVNGASTTIQSSSTTIPFGVLTAGEIETLAQDLTVITNAIHGFVVTVESDGQLESSTGADIDNFDDDTIGNPKAWESPSNVITDEWTWGHWGVTTQDDQTTRAVEFGANEWQGVSTTPTVLFSHAGPADGATAGVGSTRVGYQVEISPLQEAAQDYSAVLTYIATPTF